MGRKTITRQLEHCLHDKMAFGESRHEAKNELRNSLGEDYRFGMSDDKIHALETFDTYKKVSVEYAKWLIEEKGVNKYIDIKDTERYACEYLQERLDKGLSVWTIKMERSALGKIYGQQIELRQLPKRQDEDITRSRKECEHDKHFSVSKNADLVLIASACGTRREDLGKVRMDSFKVIEGRLYVEIKGSKGGRNRIAPVLEVKEKEVKAFLERLEKEGKRNNIPLFGKVHSKMDVHSYRRAYAKALYREVSTNRKIRDIILRNYPTRCEMKTTIVNGERITKEVQSQYFRPKGTKEIYDRDDLYVVSQALGHNRIDVTYHSYLK